MGAMSLQSGRAGGGVTVVDEAPQVPKAQWTMPLSTLLSRPRWSARRHAAMLALGSYMVVALVLLVVKSVQLAGG
jgi:hypothetical protein